MTRLALALLLLMVGCQFQAEIDSRPMPPEGFQYAVTDGKECWWEDGSGRQTRHWAVRWNGACFSEDMPK